MDMVGSKVSPLDEVGPAAAKITANRESVIATKSNFMSCSVFDIQTESLVSGSAFNSFLCGSRPRSVSRVIGVVQVLLALKEIVHSFRSGADGTNVSEKFWLGLMFSFAPDCEVRKTYFFSTWKRDLLRSSTSPSAVMPPSVRV